MQCFYQNYHPWIYRVPYQPPWWFTQHCFWSKNFLFPNSSLFLARARSPGLHQKSQRKELRTTKGADGNDNLRKPKWLVALCADMNTLPVTTQTEGPKHMLFPPPVLQILHNIAQMSKTIHHHSTIAHDSHYPGLFPSQHLPVYCLSVIYILFSSAIGKGLVQQVQPSIEPLVTWHIAGSQ